MCKPKFQVGDWVRFINQDFSSYYKVLNTKSILGLDAIYTLQLKHTEFQTEAYGNSLQLITPEERTLLLLGVDLNE